MKFYSILLTIFGLINGLVAQQSTFLDFSQLDKQGLQTDIFLTDVKPFTPLLNVEKIYFSGTDFSECYQDLVKNDVLNRFPHVEFLKELLQPISFTDIISIGLIHTEYDVLSQNAFENEWVSIENNVLKKDSNKVIFDKIKQTVIAPLSIRKKGLKTTFVLDSSFYINTTSSQIQSIQANFDDGNGYYELMLNNELEINYTTDGKKELAFKIYLENGEIIERTSSIKIEYSNEDLFDLFSDEIQTIVSNYIPDLSIYNDTDDSPGVCEYQLFISPDGILDKPIFVVDGFDPGDTRNIQSIYNMFEFTNDETNETQNLADYIRNEEGYDVIIVNFPGYLNSNGNPIDGGADYIERNALAFVTLLEEINSLKEGNEQNVIIGPSMGGLITRYALRYMELNDLEHDTRLWISVDSPHNGANVALSVQHLINYLGYGFPDIDEIKAVVEGMLRSKAAQQMLISHLDGHNYGSVGIPAGAPGYFAEFQDRMSSIGFPQQTRNIAVTNGSGTGKIFPDFEGNSVYPSFKVMDGNVDVGTVLGIINARLKVLAKFMPYAGETLEILNVKVQTQAIVWITIDEFSASIQQYPSTDGIDTAPGGLFDVLGLLDSFEIQEEYIDMLTGALAIVNVGAFNFIPTTSALALYNQPDFYAEIDLGEGDTPWDDTLITNPETPFVNWYMADENEGHVFLTNGNTNFILCEIIEPDYELDLITNETVGICEGEDLNASINFTVTKGCFQEAHLSIEGSPEGSNLTLSESIVYQDGIIQLYGTSFSAGEYVISIIPDGKIEKAVEINLTVYEINPDLSENIEYSIDGGNNYYQANSVAVAPGSSVSLRIPNNIYSGTVEWYNPLGEPQGANPQIENIQIGDDEEGIWEAIVTFSSYCTPPSVPTHLFFEISVDEDLLHLTEFTSDFNIRPNPSSGKFYIESNTTSSIEEIIIHNLNGEEVSYSTSFNPKTDVIDLTHFSSGMYLLTIRTQEQIRQHKLIKN